MSLCKKNRKLIVWQLLDELDATQAAELRTHLESCPVCWGYHQQMLGVTERLKGLQSLSSAEADAAVRVSASGSVRPFRRLAQPRVQQSPFVPVSTWRLLMPALAIIIMALFIIATLERQSPFPIQPLVPSRAQREPAPAIDLLPSIANYRAIANQSLDQLDELLSRQGRKPVAPGLVSSPGTVALLNIPD